MAKTAVTTSVGVGTCIGHIPPIPMIGVVISGSSVKIVEGNGVARVGDVVLGLCGHTGVISEGSSSVKVEGENQSRVGDVFVGVFSGSITTGASNHETG